MDTAGHLDRAVNEKKPVPEIDFSLHTMEDGTQVSTQERVCKGRVTSSPPNQRLTWGPRRASTRIPPAH